MESKWRDASSQDNGTTYRTSAFSKTAVAKPNAMHVHRPTSFRIDDLIVANEQTLNRKHQPRRPNSPSPPIFVDTTPTPPRPPPPTDAAPAMSSYSLAEKLSSSLSSTSPPPQAEQPQTTSPHVMMSATAESTAVVNNAIELQRQLLMQLMASTQQRSSGDRLQAATSSSTNLTAAAFSSWPAVHPPECARQLANCSNFSLQSCGNSCADGSKWAQQAPHPSSSVMSSSLWPVTSGSTANAMLQQYASLFSASLAAASSSMGLSVNHLPTSAAALNSSMASEFAAAVAAATSGGGGGGASFCSFPTMRSNSTGGSGLTAGQQLCPKQLRRRKARTVFSDMQLNGLEKRFVTQRYLSTPERMELASILSSSETQVKTWFQNRRMKHKKHERKVKDEADIRKRYLGGGTVDEDDDMGDYNSANNSVGDMTGGTQAQQMAAGSADALWYRARSPSIMVLTKASALRCSRMQQS